MSVDRRSFPDQSQPFLSPTLQVKVNKGYQSCINEGPEDAQGARKRKHLYGTGFRASGVQEMSEINLIRYDKNLDPLSKRQMIQSIKQSFSHHSHDCSSFEVILGLINCTGGPNHFILPIQFYSKGIITMILVNLFLGYFIRMTAEITHRHAKLSENDYLITIKRIAGPIWEKLYFIASMICLWVTAITFFLTGCDAAYSGIGIIFSVDLPSRDEIVFSEFSYQYVGLAFLVVNLLLVIPKNLSWLFAMTSKATFIAFFGVLFIIVVGIYDLIVHTPKFSLQGISNATSISLFGSLDFMDIIYSVGVFELSYSIHNEVINLLRTGKDQTKNTRNLAIAYYCVQFIYISSGIFGAVIIYVRSNGNSDINTLLSLFSSEDPTIIYVFAVINQVLIGIQMLALSAIVVFITRSQFFSLVLGEENAPSEWAYHSFNIFIVGTLFLTEMFNFSPSTVMCVAGAFVGFIIIYLVPIYIHLKCLNIQSRKVSDRSLLAAEQSLSIASVIVKRESKVSNKATNVLYSLLIVQGGVTVVGVLLYLATGRAG